MKNRFWAAAKQQWAKSRWYHALASLAMAHFFIALGREDLGWSYMHSWQYWLDLPGIVWVSWSSWFVLVWWTSLLQPAIGHWTHQKFKLIGTYLAVLVWFLLQLGAVLWLSWGQKLWEGSFLFNEGPVAALLLALLMLHQLRKTQKSIEAMEAAPPVVPLFLEGRMGSEVVLIAPSEVLFIEIVGEQCVACLLDFRKLRLTTGMASLEAQLPPELFFRANRQLLVHKQACESYITERSGRLQLNIRGRNEAVAVSQHKGVRFKTWLLTA